MGYSGTELYDPSASTWIKISDPNLTFSGHKEVLLLNGKVLMVGGYQSELFDPSTGLNQFSGNYIQAEMIKAFLSSTEYRRRFGP